MHDIIKRYMGKTPFVNSFSLLLYRISPNFVREQAVYLLYQLRKAKLAKTRFVIFAQGRTGSTLLVDLMNSHPDIMSLGEILDGNVIKKVSDPVKFAGGLCSIGRKKACGFKVKVYQLTSVHNLDPETVLQDFHANGWKIIYLVRTNLLRHAISDIRSEKTGHFHNVNQTSGNPATDPENNKIHVGIDELIRTIEFRKDCISQEELALNTVPHLRIEYESDLLGEKSQQDALHRIFDYLELTEHDVKTSFRKVTAKDMSQDIENYEELQNFLESSDYAKFLGWG